MLKRAGAIAIGGAVLVAGGVTVAKVVDNGGSSSPSTAGTTLGGASTSTGTVTLDTGQTVLLKARSKASGCTLGALPDRGCSPGAYYSGLPKRVICSPSFHTSSVRNVSDRVKHDVETEYGLAPKAYGSTLEIDHIVSLELGGSNDPSNLYPEQASPAGNAPGFRVKDKLENRLHDLVCAGQITLRTARSQIASNWVALYKRTFGVAP